MIINNPPNEVSFFIAKCLKKQFESVGEKYNPKVMLKDGWYLKHTWTSKEREKFGQWFIKNIQKDLKISKKGAEQEWQYYNLMWGWRDEI